ncbi:hypothetical protein DFJ63DRAFT_312902 [Scheffersomyces coipomensis]|uniref:uncharacterized protein n=1 Tax=Scheffersomyces coipomensis TaxID=1788519 RepID=UPI00315DF173
MTQVKRRRLSFNNDEYILKFFKHCFPKFPYDILIIILSLLPIPKIILLQSLINDDFVKLIRIKQITKLPWCIKYPHDTFPMNFEDKMRINDEIIKTNQLTKRVVKLSKTISNNNFQINFDFSESSLCPIKTLDYVLGNAKNIVLELELGSLKYIEIEKFKCFQLAGNVIKMSFKKEIGIDIQEPCNIELDISNYSKLETLKTPYSSNVKKLSLDSSFQTLTDLTTTSIIDNEDLSKFTNLKSLSICYGKDLYIKKLPRSIISLFIDFEDNGNEIKIESKDDWPPSLTTLSLLISDRAFGDVGSNLPETLKSFQIEYNSEHSTYFPQLPHSITELIIKSDYAEKCMDNLLHKGLRKIEIKVIPLNEPYMEIFLPQGLSEFHWSIPYCPFLLDGLIFNNTKASLKTLHIERIANDIPFNNLNFEDFSTLEEITLDGCKISLHNLKLPISLKSLKVRDESLSIDKMTVLFKDPHKYFNLQNLQLLCRKGYTCCRIKLPINLRTLAMPCFDSKQLFIKIFNNKSLMKAKVYDESYIVTLSDEFGDRENNSNFDRLRFSLKTSFNRTIIDSFYDNIESITRRKIPNRVYNKQFTIDLEQNFAINEESETQ